MNIFFLDRDPWKAAQAQCDKHVVKMPTESAQMLSTVHWCAEATRRGLSHGSAAWWDILLTDLRQHDVCLSDLEDLARAREALNSEHRKIKRSTLFRLGREIMQAREPDNLLYGVYSPTHVNHPCSVWVRSGRGNYDWLVEHAMSLCGAYRIRYGRTHGTMKTLFKLDGACPRDVVADAEFFDPPQCVPEDVRVEGDPVEAYRQCYRKHKSYMTRWRYCDPPSWWKEPNDDISL